MASYRKEEKFREARYMANLPPFGVKHLRRISHVKYARKARRPSTRNPPEKQDDRRPGIRQKRKTTVDQESARKERRHAHGKKKVVSFLEDEEIL
jgi:hypothetical protein